MKRIVSLVLAISMVLGMFPMAFASNGLKDVEGTKYEAAVEALIELGVVNGYPDGTYLPDNVVTRGELAKLLVTAYGLESAADVAKGVTPFEDVNAAVGGTHWASGYINVSSDYKFVNGYPDGSFKADNTVTYAEAITMCLRVLGYANEVDSKGTWPTNYIAKAQDLKLMKDVEFKSYNDGAKRGDVALLIWNMLRTEMWEVTGESEGDGLQSNPNRLMLNVKFSDYAYYKEAEFVNFSILPDKKDEEAKVYVTLNTGIFTEDGEIVDTLEYAGNDFYKFVPGTEVEVLVNTEDEELLTMVPTSDNKLAEGTKEVMEDKYDYSGEGLTNEAFSYMYASLSGKKVANYVTINSRSIFVDEVEVKEKSIRINEASKGFGSTTEYVDFDLEEIVLADGERASIKDIKVGDILTQVTVTYANGTTEVFYVMGGSEVEGEFDRYVVKYFEDSTAEYLVLTVDGKEYVVDANATYVEDPTEEDLDVVSFIGVDEEKMEGEEVTVKLDPFFGKVVRVEFDGKIDAGEDKETVKFYGILADVEKVDDGYEVTLVDENGEVTFPFATSSYAKQLAKTLQLNIANIQVESTFAVVTLNELEEVEDLVILVNHEGETGDFVSTIDYGTEANEYYNLIADETGLEYDEDKRALVVASGDIAYRVSNSVVLVKLVFDDKGTPNKDNDDTYTIEFVEGAEALEEIEAEDELLIITDADDTYGRAKYVVMCTDASSKSDLRVSKVVDTNEKTPLVGGSLIKLEVDDEEVTAKISENVQEDMRLYQLVVYKMITNSKGEDIFEFVEGLRENELTSGEETHGYIVDVDKEDSSLVSYYDFANSLSGDIDLADEDVMKFFEEFTIVLVNVEDSDEDGLFEVSTFDVKDYEDVTLRKEDRISVTGDVLFIIRGMGEKTVPQV